MSIGLVIGLGTMLLAASISGLDLFPLQALCKTDEAPGSCLREWLNAAAGIGAVATIVLLLREQRFTREVAILQTLDTRARLVRGRQIARRLNRLGSEIKQSGFRMEGPRINQRPPIQPTYLVSNLIEIERLLIDPIWEQAIDFDDRIMMERATTIPIVTDILHTFSGRNIDYFRLPHIRITPELVSQTWEEDVTAHEIVSLAYRLEGLSRSIETLANELTNFRGTRYFRETEPTAPDDDNL